MSWTRRHLLDVDDLTADELELILEGSEQMRRHLELGGGRLEALGGHDVALLFAEPSTRTRLSFERAARHLAGQTFVLDPPSSSLVKGETLADTVRNLDAIGFSVLVVRHHRSGAPWVAARHFGGHVVNAGDGWHAHPTQALLDLFTLRRALGGGDGLRGRKIVIVGDLLHSRVAHSNLWTLAAAGVDLWLCGPRPWLRGYDRLVGSLPGTARVTLSDDLVAALDAADAVMALRVQKERMATGALSVAEYVERYQINSDRLALARPGALFMHPGPINEGVEVSREVAIGPRSLTLEQARNGVPVRMAVLALLAGAQTSSATRDFSSTRR